MADGVDGAQGQVGTTLPNMDPPTPPRDVMQVSANRVFSSLPA